MGPHHPRDGRARRRAAACNSESLRRSLDSVDLHVTDASGGDYVLVDKGARWPARGDLVVFTDPSDPNELLVKRIVGLGGEEIVVQGHDVYINCEPPADGCRPVAEPYADFSDEVRGAKDVAPLEIPSGAVFVMADNRNAGEDSRHWGPVSRAQIFGRPAWIYWSSDPDGHPRWSRIGRRVR